MAEVYSLVLGLARKGEVVAGRLADILIPAFNPSRPAPAAAARLEWNMA